MKIFYSIILMFILFFPKVNIIDIPGTYIGIRIEDILILAFGIVYLIKENKKIKLLFKDKNFKKIMLLFLVYVFVCFISTTNGIINENIEANFGLLYLVRKIEYFVFIFLGYDFIKKGEEDSKTILNMLNLSVIIHFIIVLLQKFNIIGGFINGEYVSNASTRVLSTFNGPYELATYFTLLLPIYIIKLMKLKNDKRNLIQSIIFIFIIFIVLYLSQSRTSIIIAIITIILIPIIELRKKMLNYIKVKKKLAFFIGIVAITLIAILSVLLSKTTRFKTLDITSMIETVKISWENKSFEKYQEEGFYILGAEDTDFSFKIRINKWMALIDGALKHPILGLGLSITREACDGNYIRIFAESGILGIVFWLILLVNILKTTLKHHNEIGIVANYGVVVLIITAIFIDVFEASKIMMFYWFILGSSYSINKLENNLKGRKDEE